MDESLTERVRSFVAGRDDLLNEEPLTEHPLAGHCYVASEAYFHLTGGYDEWYVERTSVRVDDEWVTHWYLRDRKTGELCDLTAEQFGDRKIPYGKGTRTGFLTSDPSSRAQTVIEGVK